MTSATPKPRAGEHGKLTRTVEGDLLAEYRYCEASFNGMRDHAFELEAERDQLKEQVAELNIVRKYAHDLAVSLAALREQMEACKAAHMSNCLDADKLRTQVGSFREALEDIRDELQQANGGKGPSLPLSTNVLEIARAALDKHGR